jgi:hypothetical protein
MAAHRAGAEDRRGRLLPFLPGSPRRTKLAFYGSGDTRGPELLDATSARGTGRHRPARQPRSSWAPDAMSLRVPCRRRRPAAAPQPPTTQADRSSVQKIPGDAPRSQPSLSLEHEPIAASQTFLASFSLDRERRAPVLTATMPRGRHADHWHRPGPLINLKTDRAAGQFGAAAAALPSRARPPAGAVASARRHPVAAARMCDRGDRGLDVLLIVPDDAARPKGSHAGGDGPVDVARPERPPDSRRAPWSSGHPAASHGERRQKRRAAAACAGRTLGSPAVRRPAVADAPPLGRRARRGGHLLDEAGCSSTYPSRRISGGCAWYAGGGRADDALTPTARSGCWASGADLPWARDPERRWPRSPI